MGGIGGLSESSELSGMDAVDGLSGLRGLVARVFSCRRILLILILLPVASSASGFEAFDGRLQAHGYFESQLRAISADYSEDWDVTQWYQIFNLEIELDLITETIGPVDLLSGYVRAEVRYDCIYSRGCGMFRSMNAYGDRAKSLPRRLNNAHGRQAAGAILLEEDTGRLSGGSTDPVGLEDTLGWNVLAGEPGADELDGNPSPSDPTCVGMYGAATCRVLAGGPDSLIENNDDPFEGAFVNFQDYRFTHRQARGGTEHGLAIRPAGPWLPKNEVEPLAALADRPNLFDHTRRSDVLRAAVYNTEIIVNGATPAQALVAADAIRGAGALPFRPIPVIDEGDKGVGDTRARGMYLPSRGLMQAMSEGRVDSLPLNFSESERAWNRGASQQDEKELKEAYLDLELFDSRLWLRIGKQQIVWGKTELFRSTDQWNPQDLALASLPSLEESRIGLWAMRGVYSFYEVGPLQDVRLETAFLFDQFESADLGACGEPYTVNLVCLGVLGAFSHGIFATALAGVDTPPSPWESLRGWEVGARFEFRWDRFSFAISDYYGWSDLPHVDLINLYERNVDPNTGRMRIAGGRGRCTDGTQPDCLTAGPERRDTNGITNRRLADPRNALQSHPANMQMFAVVCSTTVGLVALDRTVCAQNALGSQVAVPFPNFSVSQFSAALLAGSFEVSVLCAGDPQCSDGVLLDLVELESGERLRRQDPGGLRWHAFVRRRGPRVILLRGQRHRAGPASHPRAGGTARLRSLLRNQLRRLGDRPAERGDHRPAPVLRGLGGHPERLADRRDGAGQPEQEEGH
jgi:hypothetical protein